MNAPQTGQAAPDFKLPRDNGETFGLSDQRGTTVVLFFYPKDDTTGCTAEARDFSALKGEFDKVGALVVGISPDSVKKHVKFIAKHELTVPLVSDEEKKTLMDYGVWVEKSMYGRKYMGVERSTFVIGPDGRIAAAWRKVSVPGHAQEVLDAVRNL